MDNPIIESQKICSELNLSPFTVTAGLDQFSCEIYIRVECRGVLSQIAMDHLSIKTYVYDQELTSAMNANAPITMSHPLERLVEYTNGLDRVNELKRKIQSAN